MISSSLVATRTETRDLTTVALLIAMLAASAWISIPIGAVPVTLQVFIVLLAGLILSPSRAAAVVGGYLLLGLIGIPVFAGAQGGLGVLAGPTGGYLWGFLAAAPVVSMVHRALCPRRSGKIGMVVAGTSASAVGVVVIYLCGWCQLILITGMDATAAFLAGVAPFVIMDVAKGIVATAVSITLQRVGVVR